MITKANAVNAIGSVKELAAMLNISVQAVYDWPDVIPEAMAARLDRITNGQLRYDHVFYMAHKRAKKQAA